jgi:electron transfer flavoprotein alpha subunit
LPDVILLAPNAVDVRLPFVGAGEQVAAEQFATASSKTASPYKDLGIEEIDAAQVALEEADFIVSAGNGVTDVPAFERLASTVGAAVGASRVAVDDGKFPRDKQIGATGKTVDASIYIAFGISGAVQHLQGIKDCRHVIAVNLDASAPIAKRANLTIIGDAAETIAALTDAAAAARSARANPGAMAAHGSNVPNAAKLEGALA